MKADTWSFNFKACQLDYLQIQITNVLIEVLPDIRIQSADLVILIDYMIIHFHLRKISYVEFCKRSE